jgi:hypothetical protein
VRLLEADGLGDFIARPEPLTGLALHAAHVWNWCGGWVPERWPLYAQLHDFGEIAVTEHLLMVIRNHTRAAP